MAPVFVRVDHDLLAVTTACSISDIGGAVGNPGDSLENMFNHIGEGFRP